MGLRENLLNEKVQDLPLREAITVTADTALDVVNGP